MAWLLKTQTEEKMVGQSVGRYEQSWFLKRQGRANASTDPPDVRFLIMRYGVILLEKVRFLYDKDLFACVSPDLVKDSSLLEAFRNVLPDWWRGAFQKLQEESGWQADRLELVFLEWYCGLPKSAMARKFILDVCAGKSNCENQ